ncbi:MAG: acetyl-CoA carboxylase carboxyl transferase subunit alpha, partial [Bacteroidota bacterium]
ESCSSILWKSWDYKEQAAEALRLTARDLVEMGIADSIIPEPVGGAHRTPAVAAELLKSALVETLNELSAYPIDQILERRHQRYMGIGVWESEGIKA